MDNFTLNRLDHLVDNAKRQEDLMLKLKANKTKKRLLNNLGAEFQTLADAYDTANNDHYGLAIAEAEWIRNGCNELI